jgi:transposase-like protein
MMAQLPRDVLGLWFQRTEGAKFWMHVLTAACSALAAV